ncbi:MAG: phosphoglucomutase [Thermoprotei archaeon]
MLFGTSGIRGAYPFQISNSLAVKLGFAVASYVNRGFIVVGWDGRNTSRLLGTSIISGINSAGLDAIAVGMVPTPVLAYSVRYFGASGGVMVTASHNPPEFNGFKVYFSGGRESIENEEQAIESIMNEFGSDSHNEYGRVEFRSISYAYIKDLYNTLFTKKLWKPRIIIDCGGGVAGLYTPRVLSMLSDAYVINDYVDPFFSGREAEPRPDVLLRFSKGVVSLGFDIGLAHDGDGDRLAVIDENGNFVDMSTIIALMAKRKVEENGGGIVVVSVDTSMSVREVVEHAGGHVEVTKLGKTHAKLRSGVVLAAEPWKIIDPSWGFWQDGIYAAGQLIRFITSKGKRLRQILDEEKIPIYPGVRLSFYHNNLKRDAFMEFVKENLPSAFKDVMNVIDIDGIKVETKRGWALVRVSGTEPKIRLYAEGFTVEDLEYIVKVSREIIEKGLGK